MKKNRTAGAELRRAAEARLKEKRTSSGAGHPSSVEETIRLVHELQVHEIELEIQNEQLKTSQAEVAVGLALYADLYDFAPMGYVSLDRDGVIRRVNLTGTRLLGVERSRLVNRRFGLFVAEGDRRAFSEFLERVFASEAKEGCELALPQAGSQPLVVQVEGTRSADGQECRAVLLDITERKRADEALCASRQITEGIINAITVRVFWKDKNLVYLGCNAAFARDGGFADPKDVIGKDDYQMGWRDQAELYRADDRTIIEGGVSILNREESQTTPAGNIMTLLTSKIPLRSSNGEIKGVIGTYMDITERKRAEQEMREFPHQLLQAQEAERRQIGKELHDSVAQDIAAVVISLSTAEKRLTKSNEEARTLVAGCLAVLRNSARDVRELSRLLHPPFLEEAGLLAALGQYVESFQRYSGMKVHAEFPEAWERFSAAAELVLFRVTQEALNNAKRHSGCRSAMVRLRRSGDTVTLEVEDHGRGLASAASRAKERVAGIGISGMRERLQHLGGRLEIESKKHGTTVRAVLKIDGLLANA